MTIGELPPVGAMVRLPGESNFVKIGGSMPSPDGVVVFTETEMPGQFRQVKLDPVGLSNLEVLSADGQADSTQLLAALWSDIQVPALHLTRRKRAAVLAAEIAPSVMS